MATRERLVTKYWHLVVAATAVIGTAYASWLYVLGAAEAERRCGGSAPTAVEVCSDAREPTTITQERVAIPTEGLPHKGAGIGATKVTMIECSDFECPYSRRARDTVDTLLAHNDDVAFFHVNFPLGMFEHSVLKANASVAAQRQGHFWQLHDALYDAPIESEADAIALARELGLDAERFAADLRSPATRAEVDRQRALCKDVGVRAVPTFFINGRRVVGSLPVDQLQRVIDEERP